MKTKKEATQEAKDLMAAISRGDISEATRLLALPKLDIEEEINHITFLFFAVGINNGEMVTLLLEAGANPDKLGPMGKRLEEFARDREKLDALRAFEKHREAKEADAAA